MPNRQSKQTSLVRGSSESVHTSKYNTSEPRQRTAEAIDIQDDNRQAGGDRNSIIHLPLLHLWEEHKSAEEIITAIKTFQTITDEQEETGTH
ncbi:hypothetical protein SK128_017029, partial [Halocaridina rubra]